MFYYLYWAHFPNTHMLRWWDPDGWPLLPRAIGPRKCETLASLLSHLESSSYTPLIFLHRAGKYELQFCDLTSECSYPKIFEKLCNRNQFFSFLSL